MAEPKAERPRADALRAAFAHCEGLARSHYENFPVASRLVPAALRPHVCAVYAFARTADDFADEPRFAGRRLALLADWETRLDECLAGRADHPIFLALAETIRTHELPDRWLRDLLDAFRQDCTVTRYRDWSQLLEYCRRSANPVGRMVLHLFGFRDEQRGEWSDAICTALQLTNFWQDVAIDRDRGRIYLPEEDLSRHGVDEREIATGRVGPAFHRLLAELVGRTRDRFDAGRPLLGSVGGRLALELRCVWLGGMRILDRIEAGGFDPFCHRPTLTRADVLVAAGRALFGLGVSR